MFTIPSIATIVDANSFSFSDIEFIHLKQAIMPKNLALDRPVSTLPGFRPPCSLILLAKAINISYAEEPASVSPISIHVH